MSRMALAVVTSFAGRVEIQRPSRRTVTRSAIWNTSSMRWEMNRMATPCRRSAAMIRNSWLTSCAESDAVGSSMISTRTLSEMALAISTVCCWARVRPRAGSVTFEADVQARQHLLCLAPHPPPVHDAAAVPVADEDVLGDRQVGEDHRLLVDGRDTQPLGILGRCHPDRLTVHEDLARIELLDAGHDLDERRLAGAVLAQQGMDLAAVEREGHVRERLGRPERPGYVTHLQDRRDRRVSPRPGCSISAVDWRVMRMPPRSRSGRR